MIGVEDIAALGSTAGFEGGPGAGPFVGDFADTARRPGFAPCRPISTKLRVCLRYVDGDRRVGDEPDRCREAMEYEEADEGRGVDDENPAKDCRCEILCSANQCGGDDKQRGLVSCESGQGSRQKADDSSRVD
jgi:hypothetical protein